MNIDFDLQMIEDERVEQLMSICNILKRNGCEAVFTDESIVELTSDYTVLYGDYGNFELHNTKDNSAILVTASSDELLNYACELLNDKK